ncbi:hypothetical protein C8F01DRAFT_1293983 [Mycena amicta]|nr:hypothetical protein C8F01DRAFT_1293983 [Mycena amicta]
MPPKSATTSKKSAHPKKSSRMHAPLANTLNTSRKTTAHPNDDSDEDDDPAPPPPHEDVSVPSKRTHPTADDDLNNESSTEDDNSSSNDEDAPAGGSRIKTINHKGGRAGRGKKGTNPRKRVKADNLGVIRSSQHAYTHCSWFRSDSMRRIYRKSRILCRIVNPFIEIRGLIDIKIDDLAGLPLTDDKLPRLALYDLLVSHIPVLDRLISQPNHDKLDEAVYAIQEAMNQGKPSDTAHFRHGIAEYIVCAEIPSINPKFHRRLKSDRGYSHNIARAFLIPQKHIDRLTDASFWKEILDGDIHITADDFPALMYDQHKADPDDVEAGLMEGYLPIHVLRAILHGPQHALEPIARVGGSIAAKNRIKTITGRLIAYAHVQTWFAYG